MAPNRGIRFSRRKSLAQAGWFVEVEMLKDAQCRFALRREGRWRARARVLLRGIFELDFFRELDAFGAFAATML
jgi:hypothetical protein